MSDAHLCGIFAGLYGQPRVVPVRFHEAAGASWLDGYDFGAGKPVGAVQDASATPPPRADATTALSGDPGARTGMVGRRVHHG